MLVELINLIGDICRWVENIRSECRDEECTAKQVSLRIHRALHALKIKDITVFYKSRVISTSSNFEGYQAVVTIDDLEILDVNIDIPVCVSITISNQTKGKNIEYKDIVAAAVVNVRNGGSFVSERKDKIWFNRSKGERYFELTQNNTSQLDTTKDLYLCNIENMITRDRMLTLFKKAGSTNIDSSGSHLYDALYVISGQANAYMNMEMKNIHLGAIYFLSTINSTALTTMKGEKLSNKPWGTYIEKQLGFDFSDTEAVVMAGTEDYLKKFVKMLT